MLCHVDLPEMRRLLVAHHVVALRPGDPAGAREFATFEAGMHYVEDTYLKVLSSGIALGISVQYHAQVSDFMEFCYICVVRQAHVRNTRVEPLQTCDFSYHPSCSRMPTCSV